MVSGVVSVDRGSVDIGYVVDVGGASGTEGVKVFVADDRVYSGAVDDVVCASSPGVDCVAARVAMGDDVGSEGKA